MSLSDPIYLTLGMWLWLAFTVIVMSIFSAITLYITILDDKKLSEVIKNGKGS